MLRNLRNEKPVPTPAIQYAGGEPTVRKDLPDLIRMAREEGFSHTQIATNGILGIRTNMMRAFGSLTLTIWKIS